MNALLSINPKYVNAIASGEKQYEFRKKVFKNKELIKIYIYATSPVKKIVGAFQMGDIIAGHPGLLWNQCQSHSGMGEQEFFRYFGDAEYGFAIEINSFEKPEEPIDPQDLIPHFVAPQSFCYLDFTPF